MGSEQAGASGALANLQQDFPAVVYSLAEVTRNSLAGGIEPMNMTSSRPYLIRALYEWIVENECTPCLLVDAAWPGTSVPEQFVEDGQIVLNISPMAVRDLDMNNQAVSFLARFNGEPCEVYVPVSAVSAVYARENGQGTVFDPEQPGPEAVAKSVETNAPPPEKEQKDTGKEGKSQPGTSKKRKSATVLKLIR